MFSSNSKNDDVIETREEAIDFLRRHQPMPDQLTLSLKKRYLEVLDYFERNPENTCISLFINSLNNDMSGIYSYVEEVLQKQDRTALIAEMKNALKSDNIFTLRQMCWMAWTFEFEELESEIRPLLKHPDEEVAENAKSYFYFVFDEDYD